MASKKRSWGWLFLLLLIAAGGAGGWWYYKRPKNETVTYRTGKISKGDVVQAVTASGQLNPVINVQVGSQISGILQKIHVDFNSPVKEGQVIAQLDDATYRATVNQAEGELANANAALELAQLNARRSESLFKDKLIPQQDFEKSQIDLHQAQAAVKIREASLERAKVDLARTTIYAPVDGIVISRNVDVGQTVAASLSAPVLFMIANDLSRMQIDAMVSEADVGGIEDGQKVTFSVDAYPGVSFLGKVIQVRNAPITNQNVVCYDTVIEVNNPDMKLKPGMTATVSIITAERNGVLKVPNAALRFRPPEGANVLTNAPAASPGGTNSITSSTNAPGESASGLNFAAGRGSDMREQIMKRFDKNGDGQLDDAERQAMRAEFQAMAAQGGGGFGGFGGGAFGSRGASKPSAEKPGTRVVYLLKEEVGKPPLLEPRTIQTGITDGAFTEVVSGLKEEEVVVVGANLPQQDSSSSRAGTSNPANPFGGVRRRF